MARDRRHKFHSTRREVRERLISEMTLTHSLKYIGLCHMEKVGKLIPGRSIFSGFDGHLWPG